MRKILQISLIMLAIVAFSACNKKVSNEATPNDWDFYGLEGNVKQCITTQIIDGVTYVTTMDFNENGFLTQLTETRDDCTPIYTCIYDGNGNITDETYTQQCDSVWHINQTDLIEEKDEQGRLKQLTYKIPDGDIIELELYTYDDNGNLTEFIRQNAHCENEYEEHNTYDSRGNMVENQWSNESKPKITRYAYDENNRVIKKTNIDANGNEISYSEITYDESNRVLTTKDYVGKTMTQEQSFEYNSDDTYCRTTIYYVDGWEKEVATFNQNNYMTRQQLFEQNQTEATSQTCFYYNDQYTLDSLTITRGETHETQMFQEKDDKGNLVRVAVGPQADKENRTIEILVTTREIIYF
ncbi:MAG: hypothetical protein Q4D14_03680 [Bacteroidales bacterium]|nr:hypothetical protein [Bacteroidales bacterium]